MDAGAQRACGVVRRLIADSGPRLIVDTVVIEVRFQICGGLAGEFCHKAVENVVAIERFRERNDRSGVKCPSPFVFGVAITENMLDATAQILPRNGKRSISRKRRAEKTRS